MAKSAYKSIAVQNILTIVLIESWKYPPVTNNGWQGDYVDKLSLALSLREDEDPRVEGEVEFLIEQTVWKD